MVFYIRARGLRIRVLVSVYTLVSKSKSIFAICLNGSFHPYLALLSHCQVDRYSGLSHPSHPSVPPFPSYHWIFLVFSSGVATARVPFVEEECKPWKHGICGLTVKDVSTGNRTPRGGTLGFEGNSAIS